MNTSNTTSLNNMINQNIKQSIHQSLKQSVDQSLKQSANQSVKQSQVWINQPFSKQNTGNQKNNQHIMQSLNNIGHQVQNHNINQSQPINSFIVDLGSQIQQDGKVLFKSPMMSNLQKYKCNDQKELNNYQSEHQFKRPINSTNQEMQLQKPDITKILPKKVSTNQFQFQKNHNLGVRNDARNKNKNNISQNKGKSKDKNRNNNEEQQKQSQSMFDSIFRGPDSFYSQTKIFFQKNLTSSRKMCYCSADLNESQSCHRAIQWMKLKYSLHQFEDLKVIYQQLLNKKLDGNNIVQIEKDVLRTYPENKLFGNSDSSKQQKGSQKWSEKQKELRRILMALCCYDETLGYMQGINYIVGSIIYHAEEYMAFWITVYLFEQKDLREIFLKGLPGLIKHVQMIDFLVLNNLPRLFQHMCHYNIKAMEYSSKWIFSLFGCVIPIQEMGQFLDKFVNEGWSVFYQMVLVVLELKEQEIMEINEQFEILEVIDSIGLQKQGVQSSDNNSSYTKIDWQAVFRRIQKVNIDQGFIKKMLQNYDREQEKFKAI